MLITVVSLCLTYNVVTKNLLGIFLQWFSQVSKKTLYRYAALSGQPSQNRKLTEKTMEITSPAKNPNNLKSYTHLDTCHTDSRRVCGEAPISILMYSKTIHAQNLNFGNFRITPHILSSEVLMGTNLQ
jgi:hypothetical protein